MWYRSALLEQTTEQSLWIANTHVVIIALSSIKCYEYVLSFTYSEQYKYFHEHFTIVFISRLADV